MNKIVKILLFVLLGILLIGGISYYSFMNAPKASSKGKKAEISISSSQLFSQFEQDEAASNTKYMGKVIEVEGIIGDITEDENGAPVLLLEAGEGGGLGGVLCTLESSQKDKASKLNIGHSVKVKGVCTGMLMEVVLNKGILVSE